MINARIDTELKKNTEKILQGIGLSKTEAITLFFTQINLRHGLPFAVELPNAETMKAIQDMDAGIDVQVANSMEELRAQLGHSKS